MSRPLDFRTLRQQMVESQLVPGGIRSERVLEAMRDIPRHWFVPEYLRQAAYDDSALPIDCQQTISQPFIVALMTEALGLTGTERVLEVGTGSGYQAAVLSRLAAEVITIERHAELSEQAGQVLDKLGCQNVQRVVGNGRLGWPPRAPYDGILVTAASPDCPPALWEQLADGGRLVIPLGDAHDQQLQLIAKVDGKKYITDLGGCRFVPLIN